MSILFEFAIFPTDKGESVSAEVSKVIAMIRDSGVPYRLSPMGTTIETETMEEALELYRKAYDILAASSKRIYSSMKVDARAGKSGRLEGKIKSVESKIGSVHSV
ncbi:MAG TPA: MTH1187 family thiamine-binding protein [Sediminispirochaeta sp.]|nr:MTH1187 family thiamine-binding protein [Sediminispirochaeta sp.]